MLVTINVNSLSSGGIQICVSKPQAKLTLPQTYPSAREARAVLLEFGIDEKEIDDTLKLLLEVGPNQPLHLLVRDVPQKTLSDHGFKV